MRGAEHIQEMATSPGKWLHRDCPWLGRLRVQMGRWRDNISPVECEGCKHLGILVSGWVSSLSYLRITDHAQLCSALYLLGMSNADSPAPGLLPGSYSTCWGMVGRGLRGSTRGATGPPPPTTHVDTAPTSQYLSSTVWSTHLLPQPPRPCSGPRCPWGKLPCCRGNFHVYQQWVIPVPKQKSLQTKARGSHHTVDSIDLKHKEAGGQCS